MFGLRRVYVAVGVMTTLNQARRTAYHVARALGDVQAARRGPMAYGRRIARRHAYRTWNSLLRSLLRGAGL